MPYMPTTSLDPADRIILNRDHERMPYYLAVPIWISLAVIAWSPLVLVFQAVVS
jgi:hypothetical protein